MNGVKFSNGLLRKHNLVPLNVADRTHQGVNFHNNGDGTWTILGAALSTVGPNIPLMSPDNFIVGHKYLIQGSTVSTLRWLKFDQQAVYSAGKIQTYEGGYANSGLYILVNTASGAFHSDICHPQLYDLTLMYGAGNEPSTASAFRNDYPEWCDCYDDFNMLLASREISPPEPKTYKVEVPGADGELDLTTSLTNGIVKYENRKIKLKFLFMPPYSDVDERRSKIAATIHGLELDVVFDADPDHYYRGRCEVTDFGTDKPPVMMEVEINAEPYKYDTEETSITLTGAGDILVPTQLMPVVPLIYSSKADTLTYKTVQYALVAGLNIIPAVVLSQGANNILSFAGEGTKIIRFRGGEL